jgi:hypothetical protein
MWRSTGVLAKDVAASGCFGVAWALRLPANVLELALLFETAISMGIATEVSKVPFPAVS